MTQINYREAIKEDIPRLVELWKELMDFHGARDSFFSRSKEGPENFGNFLLENISKDDAVIYIAETEKEAVGYILAMIQDYPPVFEVKQYGLISDLAVTAKYRRTGIGLHLVNIAKEWFIQKGMTRAEIGVAATNEISTTFWTKMGFRVYKESRYLDLNTERTATS
jgi:ribosomal protein S18 acetylase RimI-like enzyme